MRKLPPYYFLLFLFIFPAACRAQTTFTNWRTEFFYEHRYDPGTYLVYIPHTVGVVMQRDKYMRYYNGTSSTANVVHEELFLWKSDVFEQRNRIGSPSEAPRIEKLKKKIADYEKRLQ
jgi:hypothetical protein